MNALVNPASELRKLLSRLRRSIPIREAAATP